MDKKEFFAGSPVKYRTEKEWKDFPLEFRWQKGLWFELFEKHVQFITEEIARAKAEDRVVLYLSCPVSSRGGGWSRTNIEIAGFAVQRLMRKWGSRFWILNPALYQMESREGTGLIKRHAALLTLERQLEKPIDVDRLIEEQPPTGGDYMRMWSRVLIEDGSKNLGGRFDAFYFLGPADVWDFFTQSGQINLTEGVEQYYARKWAIDPEFRSHFNKVGSEREKEFFKYYALRVGAHFSLGSHDEFAIWRILNRLRVEQRGIEGQIPGYFDGRQLGLSYAGEVPLGYGAIPHQDQH